jgi:type II secretory pathway pseudopilin PulG
MTIIVMSITVSALISALASTTASARGHRDLVVADSAVRNAAEAVKLAATGCQTGGTASTSFTWPTGFTHTVTVDGTTVLSSNATSDSFALPCPATGSTSLVTVKVSASVGASDTTQIRVRTP